MSDMARKGKSVKRKSHPTLNKLDPKLNLLLSYKIDDVLKICKKETRERKIIIKEIEEISTRINTENREERNRLEKELNDKIEKLGSSLFHGVYFPSDKEIGKDAPMKRNRPYVSVLIKGECNQKDLEGLGIFVRNDFGGLFTAFVPLLALAKLGRMPGIDYVELARPYRIDLNNAIPYSQISALQAPPLSLTGTGVVAGIVDSFLFFYHPDFRNNDGAGGDGQGSSRVLFLWDQFLTPIAGEAGPPSIPGFTPTGGSTYGVEYSQANINNELNNFGPPPAPGQLPTNNAYQIVRHNTGTVNSSTAHGTHVAGIAAGNGRAQGGTFTGAAPGSAIIFVRDSSNNYIHGDSTTVIDAFAYIFARASALTQPCVVNMSQSDNMGPHDGMSLGEQALDAILLTPGRAITLAAGNTNDKGEHINGTVTAGGTTTITLAYNNAPSPDSFEIWYDGHDSFNVTLTVNTTPAVTIGPVAPGSTSALTNLPGSPIQVQIVHVKNDPRNGDNVITIFINNVTQANTIPNTTWTIQLNGVTVINGAFEAWLDRNNRGSRTLTGAVAGQSTIAVPASSLRAISGGSHDRSGPPPTIDTYSSCGPTRDGRIKPDIATVGNSVTSTWYQLLNTTNPGVSYNAIGGTSMAAPLTAGAIALMFQCRGAGLAWSDIKQILDNNAGTPAAGIPSNTFGFGFLQAANLCSAPNPDVDVWLKDDPADTGIEPFTGSVAWLSPDIEVLDMAGNPVPNPTHDPTNFVNNIIRVTVRNRGTQTARNVEVFLYWADPATNIPFPLEWKDDGIYTGDPNFVIQSNKIVIPVLAADASAQVRYAWAPPAPGSNIRGDDHFCLIARLENEEDDSNVTSGGWSSIRGSNNIALRNTHVQEAPPGSGDAETSFFVTGSGDHDAIEVFASNMEGQFELVVPIECLPWRDLRFVNKFRHRRKGYGAGCEDDPLRTKVRRVLKSRETELITGIKGATGLELDRGTATLLGSHNEKMVITEIRVNNGTKMPVLLRARKPKVGGKPGFIHVKQMSGAKRIGGVSLELREKILEQKKVKARLVDGRLVVE